MASNWLTVSVEAPTIKLKIEVNNMESAVAEESKSKRVKLEHSCKEVDPEKKVPSVGASPPKAPGVAFSKLLGALSDKISSDDMMIVKMLYESFRGKKSSREEFIRKLRAIVGDSVLRIALSSLASSRA